MAATWQSPKVSGKSGGLHHRHSLRSPRQCAHWLAMTQSFFREVLIMHTNFSNSERAEVLTAALPYIKKYSGKTVVIKYGGNAMINAGVWSDYSLYSEEIATFGESDYDQKDSAGFINLYGLPIKVKAMVDAKNKK